MFNQLLVSLGSKLLSLPFGAKRAMSLALVIALLVVFTDRILVVGSCLFITGEDRTAELLIECVDDLKDAMGDLEIPG